MHACLLTLFLSFSSLFSGERNNVVMSAQHYWKSLVGVGIPFPQPNVQAGGQKRSLPIPTQATNPKSARNTQQTPTATPIQPQSSSSSARAPTTSSHNQPTPQVHSTTADQPQSCAPQPKSRNRQGPVTLVKNILHACGLAPMINEDGDEDDDQGPRSRSKSEVKLNPADFQQVRRGGSSLVRAA